MSTDLNKLPPAALSAAMRGGTDAWGQFGDAGQHIRYVIKASPKSRRRCGCGCKTRATHRGMCNGVCLRAGCELHMRRWAKGSGA